jgi:hypothetical protein
LLLPDGHASCVTGMFALMSAIGGTGMAQEVEVRAVRKGPSGTEKEMDVKRTVSLLTATLFVGALAAPAFAQHLGTYKVAARDYLWTSTR